MTEGPVQVNMYGIRYFINGDLSDPYVKKLMVQARNDLQGMKDRNINDIDHIWMNKPQAYKIDSQFGIDSVYIDVPKFKKKPKRIIELTEKKEKKDINVQYVFAHEVWYMNPPYAVGSANATQIGYLLCMGGGWNPPYKFIEPIIGVKEDGSKRRNVIHPTAGNTTRDTLVENGGTVYPFFWNSWKAWFSNRPYEGDLLEQIIMIEDLGDEAVTYTDIPCNLEELISYDLPDLTDEEHDHNQTPGYIWSCRQMRYDDPIHYPNGVCWFTFNLCLNYDGFCTYNGNRQDGLFITLPEVDYFDIDNSVLILGTEVNYYEYYIVEGIKNFTGWAGYTDVLPCDDWYAGREAFAETEFDSFQDVMNIVLDDYVFHTWTQEDGTLIIHDFYFERGTRGSKYYTENSPTWGCGRDISRYATYYEKISNFVDSEIKTTAGGFIPDPETAKGPCWGMGAGCCEEDCASPLSGRSFPDPEYVHWFNWEHGIRVDGQDFIIISATNDDEEPNLYNCDPSTVFTGKFRGEMAYSVCTKYFDTVGFVLCSIQRYSPNWSLADSCDDNYPGPEMWFVWINMNEETPQLYWDQDNINQRFPPPVYNAGIIPADEDEWWGGIFGAAIASHFKKIPNAPLYKDENDIEWPMLTAGQFRLIRIDTEEEKKTTETKTQFEY